MLHFRSIFLQFPFYIILILLYVFQKFVYFESYIILEIFTYFENFYANLFTVVMPLTQVELNYTKQRSAKELKSLREYHIL